MANKRDLTKHFEAIVGREVIGAFADELALTFPVGLYSREEGTVTFSEFGVTGSTLKSCRESSLFTVSGHSVVRTEGKEELRLSDFHCERLVGFLSPVIVVATPREDRPVFVTAVPTIIDKGTDVRIVLHTWAADGSPATNVSVAWLCRVRINPNTVIE